MYFRTSSAPTIPWTRETWQYFMSRSVHCRFKKRRVMNFQVAVPRRQPGHLLEANQMSAEALSRGVGGQSLADASDNRSSAKTVLRNSVEPRGAVLSSPARGSKLAFRSFTRKTNLSKPAPHHMRNETLPRYRVSVYHCCASYHYYLMLAFPHFRRSSPTKPFTPQVPTPPKPGGTGRNSGRSTRIRTVPSSLDRLL